MAKILLVIASEGYQPLEYDMPKQILIEAGHEVLTVSDQVDVAKTVHGDVSTKVDIILSEVDVNTADALYFIGGPGALEHLDNEISYKLLQIWQASGKLYGAICISPRILAKAGVLKNKKATGWNGDEKLVEFFSQHGAEYLAESVVVDDGVITADGPYSADKFGEAILEELKKRL